jgi:hypothetical protein
MKKDSTYECGDGTTYQAMDYAIQYVEKNNLESKLKEQVIDLWEEIEDKFKKSTRSRKRKNR